VPLGTPAVMARTTLPTMQGPDSPRRKQAAGRVYQFLRLVAHGINKAYWHVSVEGRESVPASGPVILAPVHRSFIDFFVVSEATSRHITYMAKDNLWRWRTGGRILEWLGAFPVDRRGTDRASLARAEEVLAAGGVLVVFPEGTRRHGPVVEGLHDGAMFLAARTGAVVVPIGIGGTEEAMPKGARLPRRVRVHLVVGEPLRPPTGSPSRRPTRRALAEATELLRKELQRLFDLARGAVDEHGGRMWHGPGQARLEGGQQGGGEGGSRPCSEENLSES